MNCNPLLASMFAALFVGAIHGQQNQKIRILSTVADENTGVRFFYQHDIKDHFYQPLIFKVVGKDDPRRNTSPLGPEGQSVFVTVEEAQHLLERLSLWNLDWQETETVGKFGPSYKARGIDFLDVTVITSEGTARRGIERSKVCKLLAGLDPAINTPRALWEFQMYRWVNDCIVSGFNPRKYPEHWE